MGYIGHHSVERRTAVDGMVIYKGNDGVLLVSLGRVSVFAPNSDTALWVWCWERYNAIGLFWQQHEETHRLAAAIWFTNHLARGKNTHGRRRLYVASCHGVDALDNSSKRC